jgi:integrase
MASTHRSKRRRKRVGRVSYYWHHGAWHIYYREGEKQVRRRVGTEVEAARAAAEVNAQLANRFPSMFSFAPLSVAELRHRFLDHHEHVARSSVATVRRYRAATQHLADFGLSGGNVLLAHELDAERFVRHLRELRVSPNGHQNSRRRPLHDKGIRFILETCRSVYGFAAKKRHLPPYLENPFQGLGGSKLVRIEDSKPIFVFDDQSEAKFFRHADDWSFPIHFLLAKTGIRPGEATHLLIEELQLDSGWLQVQNKPELGWRVKTRRERSVPLIEELVHILRRVIGERRVGPVFVRPRFHRNAVPHDCSRRWMTDQVARRVAAAEESTTAPLSRECVAAIQRSVWRDAGAVRVDTVRKSFIRIGRRCELDATCPKSWRHTFATLLQDANVDLLVRQITMGHSPTLGDGPLGMTTAYTHTRSQTQRREILRALRLWPGSLQLARNWRKEMTHDQ